jgi:hypothetical protein
VAHESRAVAGSRDRVKLGVGVMARAPSSGGKTRLAPHLSENRLRELRRALLADTLRTAGDLPPSLASSTGELPPSRFSATAGQVGGPGEVVVFVEPGDASAEVEALSATPVTCVPQVAGDLGRRMCAAVRYLLQTLDCDAAILVGPTLDLGLAGSTSSGGVSNDDKATDFGIQAGLLVLL